MARCLVLGNVSEEPKTKEEVKGMAEVKESFRELAEADLIPERDYMMRVLSAEEVGDKGWEVARCGFVDPPDKELAGRRVDFFIGQPGNWRGLSRLLQAAKMFDLPLDSEGKQRTGTSLPGVEFPAHVSEGRRNGMPENRLSPNIDYDWVEANADKEEAQRAGGSKKPSRKRTSKKTETRRRRS